MICIRPTHIFELVLMILLTPPTVPYNDVIEVSCHLYDNSMKSSVIINHTIIK